MHRLGRWCIRQRVFVHFDHFIPPGLEFKNTKPADPQESCEPFPQCDIRTLRLRQDQHFVFGKVAAVHRTGAATGGTGIIARSRLFSSPA